MGIRLFGSNCSCNTKYEVIEKVLPNPNPKNYSIIESKQIKNFLILKLKYHDCENYEGIKILVFEDMTFTLLELSGNGIDPHFCENCKSPIARFEPTKRGWQMARMLVLSLLGYFVKKEI